MSSETVQCNIADDPYSSQCFGVPMVTLKIKVKTPSVSYLTISKTLAKILQNPSLHYVVCKHPLRDVSVIHGLEETGFKLMGIGAKLHLVKSSWSANARANRSVRIEPYDDTRLDLFNSLLEETPRFFYETHYYNSPYLDSKLADGFYARWIMTDVQGRCNKNFIALQNRRIVGFITCMEKHREAKLDLIWVRKSMRGKGIGKLLITSLLNNIKPDKLVCDAYIADKKALGFYLATGFEVHDVYTIYHNYLEASAFNHSAAQQFNLPR